MSIKNFTAELHKELAEYGGVVCYGSKNTWILAPTLMDLASCMWTCDNYNITLLEPEDAGDDLNETRFQAVAFDTPSLKNGFSCERAG